MPISNPWSTYSLTSLKLRILFLLLKLICEKSYPKRISW